MITKKTALKEAGRFAAALGGPLGPRPMQRVIAEFLPFFRHLRSSGGSWSQIAALLAAAGVRSGLAERRAVRATAVNNRMVGLQAEVSTAEQKLKRLYDSIAKGIIELDDLLGEQIAILQGEREKAKAALERAQSQGAGAVTIDAAKVDAFSRLMLDLLTSGEMPALKAWLRSILGSVVVAEKTIRITGSKEVLASAVTGRNSARANVRGLVPEWRARKDSNL